MTELATRRRGDLAACDFILATDLDGTFLGGSDADRRHLYGWIEENRDTVGLIFVTGRDPEFIASLCAGGVPWPEFVVGDVGTTIARVAPETGVEPIPALETEIAAAWNDSGDRVRAALDGHPGLTLQPTGFRYRVSYDLALDDFDEGAKGIVEDLGLDWLISDNLYFDVLPKGISKGPSIRRLVEHLGIEPSRVLVAGDTMNDYSMLVSGLPAVAVGGSEPALLERLGEADPAQAGQIHKARAIGAAGIAEAIAAKRLHSI